MIKKPVLLIILDGFGIAPKTKHNAIAQARTPNLDSWLADRPPAILEASGQAVGLPTNYIGNSEVGHLTIGAGRAIEQPASFLLRAIENGSFFSNHILQQKLQELKKKERALHIIGLLSDAGVHCHEKIIHAFIKAGADAGISKIYVHPILDGRDVAPQSARVYLQQLDDLLRTIPGARIGSLHGRFYAMDRDGNWDRTERSYEILTRSLNRLGTNGEEETQTTFEKSSKLNKEDSTSCVHPDASTSSAERRTLDSLMSKQACPEFIEGLEGQINKNPHFSFHQIITWQQVLSENYTAGVTDEFIPPINLNPAAIVSNGDGIIFANYRPDRARQLTEAFIQTDFSHFKHKKIDLACFITPVSYGSHIHTEIMYPRDPVTNTLKEILSRAGKTIFSIAETEKYAHVTYFFDGGREIKFPGETRVQIPSIRVHDYINNPQMSAPEITQTLLRSLQEKPCDFYLINYANADMVGHSGNFEATKKAIEVLDAQLGQLYEVAVKEMHGTMFITADHGNAEHISDEQSGGPCTAHTTNPVPFVVLSEDKNRAVKLPLNQLADIKNFILKWMGISN